MVDTETKTDQSPVALDKLNLNTKLIILNNNNLNYYNQLSGPSGCSICNTQFKINDIIRKINMCNHFFHYECVDKWFQSKSTCPICRININENTSISLNSDESKNNNQINLQENILDSQENQNNNYESKFNSIESKIEYRNNFK